MGKKRIIQQAEEPAGEEAKSGGAPRAAKTRAKKPARLEHVHIYISASYNNTLISVADSKGDVVVASSAGAMGFRGPKKATPFAASRVVENIFEKLGGVEVGRVYIHVRGVGSGRDAAVRALVGRGINVVSLQDKTPLPHNGCRARKARRV